MSSVTSRELFDPAEELAVLSQEAVRAIGSSDWATAENKYLQMGAILDGTPDWEKDDQSIKWRDTIDKGLARISARRHAKTGIIREKMQWCRASET